MKLVSEDIAQVQTPNLQDIVRVKRRLEAEPKDWLMILDSADDLEVDIREMIPNCDHVAILITSNRSNLGSALGLEGLEVETIDQASGVNILFSWGQISHPSNSSRSPNVVLFSNCVPIDLS